VKRLIAVVVVCLLGGLTGAVGAAMWVKRADPPPADAPARGSDSSAGTEASRPHAAGAESTATDSGRPAAAPSGTIDSGFARPDATHPGQQAQAQEKTQEQSQAVHTALATVGAPGDSVADARIRRLGRLFAQMPAKDAARVLSSMSDAEVAAILAYVPDRAAAKILAGLPPAQAASVATRALPGPLPQVSRP
jgi:flagellar motility protein MotE (MotC chaperone)